MIEESYVKKGGVNPKPKTSKPQDVICPSQLPDEPRRRKFDSEDEEVRVWPNYPSGCGPGHFWDVGVQEKIEQVIEKSCPESRPDCTESKNTFLFVRKLKKIRELGQYDDVSVLKSAVFEYYKRWEKELEESKDIEGHNRSFDEVWAEFRRIWLSKDELDTIMEEAKTLHISIISQQASCLYTDKNILFLVCVCWKLQQLAPDKPFFLSNTKVARILNCGPELAGDIIRMLVADEVLIFIKSGKNCPRGTAYRFNSKGNEKYKNE